MVKSHAERITSAGRTSTSPVLCAAVDAAQLHVVKKDGSNQLLQTFDSKPSYAELEEALKAWPEAATNKSLMDRLRDEVKFIQDTAQQPGGKNE